MCITLSSVFESLTVGTLGGLLIGSCAEYYTSSSKSPVLNLVKASTTGPATTIISGLALGYESVLGPTIILAIVVYISFSVCDLYGVSLAGVGMLSTLSTALSIDAFGPVCDNAGGIAQMARLDGEARIIDIN